MVSDEMRKRRGKGKVWVAAVYDTIVCPTLMELDRGFDEFLIRGGEEEWRSLSGGFDWMVVVAACLLAEGEGEALWFVRVLPAARHKSYRTQWFGFDLMMSGRRSPELVVGDEGE
ncbi:hypothetical protein HAX54_032729 [Datura stramonium]|uniref:Uncharacterized protein n=1 Tax=Datura stramonium TaxID=4076 RepID=A0ABS8SCV6_DATST|nr:hypothetical protein [Datura stramonium]